MNSGDQFIANMRDGSVAGFKYFEFTDARQLAITIECHGEGVIEVAHQPDFHALCAEAPVHPGNDRQTIKVDAAFQPGTQALYFRYRGTGFINFHAFELR